MPTRKFKACPKCGWAWRGRAQFLGDPLTCLIGYQANVWEREPGIFLFNHQAPGCGTTMAIAAEEFLDLHQGPLFEERLTGSPDCPGHCLHQDDLEPCLAACECRFLRDVLQVVREWPKRVRGGLEAAAV